MKQVQIGITALRSPTGEFLKAVPLYEDVPDDHNTDEPTEIDSLLSHIFLSEFKKYKKEIEEESRQRKARFKELMLKRQAELKEEANKPDGTANS